MLQGSLESVEGSCKVCGSHDEEEEAGCDESAAANGSTSCSCPDNTKQGKTAQTRVVIDTHAASQCCDCPIMHMISMAEVTAFFHVFLQICPPSAMVATVATPQVWRAARWDHEKVRISPALREYATMTKQVRFEQL